LKNPGSIPPDLRAPIFAIVMRYGDATIWQKLHELGLKTASTEDKQYYYDALAFATDPKLIQKSLAITLTDELPTSRATFMVPKVARESDRPDLAWEFAKKNLKPLVAKVDALNANSYLPSLFSFFFDSARIEELKAFAKKNLSEASRKPVEIASDEIQFRADFRKRLIEEIAKQ
jgi:aminopeptidase N